MARERMTPVRCTERETGASLFKERCVLTPDRADQPRVSGSRHCFGRGTSAPPPAARLSATAVNGAELKLAAHCSACLSRKTRQGDRTRIDCGNEDHRPVCLLSR